MTGDNLTSEKPPAEVRETCSICQFPVGADEERTQCPACNLPFHAECWEQNFGCSAYGCPQVNALKPAAPQQGDAGSPGPSQSALAPPVPVPSSEPFPWDYLLLAASGLGVLGSLFAFGLPSAVLLAVVLGRRAFRKGPISRGAFLGAVLACLVGAIGGALAAYFNRKFLGPGMAWVQRGGCWRGRGRAAPPAIMGRETAADKDELARRQADDGLAPGPQDVPP